MAPLALIGCAAALFVVVDRMLSDDGGGGAEPNRAGQGSSSDTTEQRRRRRSRRVRRTTYTVKPGDTPSTIAEQTGVTVDELERLNPSLEPGLLTPGDRLRLRP